jgi:elongation factor Ts
MDCKTALEEVGGDQEKAAEILKIKGLASASKKAERETSEGRIASYIHSGGRVGSLVEVNCESDFVARTDELKELAHDLAMQVAAMSPVYVDTEEIHVDEARPPQEVCLMDQPFIKDSSRTIRDVVREVMGHVGENIRVKGFTRYALGE